MNQLRTNYSQPKSYYTNQFALPREPKFLARDTREMENAKPAKDATQSEAGQVQGSFNRMMNIGEVGGLGGRMGELEKASMRLGEAASQRRIGEMEKEAQFKSSGIGMEAKASEKAQIESQIRSLQSKLFNSTEDTIELDRLRRQLFLLG
jgi:hypothetical protein